MASQYFAILTDYGIAAFAKALSSKQPLQLATFAVGDGNGQAVTPTSNRTALVREKHRAAVSAVSLDPRNNKQVIVELTIPENIGGFYIREMGVFDNQNKLVAYANCPESFKPTETSGSGKIQVLRMVLKVASSDAVTLSIDNSVIFVTRKQLTPKTITAETENSADEDGHSHNIDKATTTTSGIVQLSNDDNSDDETKAPTLKVIKKLKSLYDGVRKLLDNYISNSKKSSSISSNSADTVATSAAVKKVHEESVAAQNSADKAQSSANDANNNANTRVSKNGDVMNGDLGIKSSNYSGLNLYNLNDARVRLESLEHENQDFFSKLSYILGEDFIHSILFPKSGNNQVVAYQDWVNAVIAGLIKRYNGAGHAWYGQHYLGCDVYRIPFSDSSGLKIQLMKGDWWDGNWITTPEVFDGYWIALGVDIGGGRDSIGFTFKDRNMMQIHTDHQTIAHILAVGWYNY